MFRMLKTVCVFVWVKKGKNELKWFCVFKEGSLTLCPVD